MFSCLSTVKPSGTNCCHANICNNRCWQRSSTACPVSKYTCIKIVLDAVSFFWAVCRPFVLQPGSVILDSCQIPPQYAQCHGTPAAQVQVPIDLWSWLLAPGSHIWRRPLPHCTAGGRGGGIAADCYLKWPALPLACSTCLVALQSR